MDAVRKWILAGEDAIADLLKEAKTNPGSMQEGLDHIKAIAHLRTVPEGYALVPEWKPIEQAPKDGTETLICRAVNADGKPIGRENFGLFVHRAAWWDNCGWIVYNSLSHENTAFFEPTHFMEIPAPPKSESL